MSLPHHTSSETCLPVISSDNNLYEYNCTFNQSAFSLINQHVFVRTKRWEVWQDVTDVIINQLEWQDLNQIYVLPVIVTEGFCLNFQTDSNILLLEIGDFPLLATLAEIL